MKTTVIHQEIANTKAYIKQYEVKRKKHLAGNLSLKHCDRMIPFLKGRLSGLEFMQLLRRRRGKLR